MANSYIRKRESKKGTRYFVTYVHRDPATGKRVNESKTFEKLGEAKAWKNEMLTRENTTGVARLSDRTLSSFADEWLTMIERKKKPTTFEGYDFQMRKNILPALGRVKLSKLSKALVQREIVDVLEDRGLSERSVHIAVTVLRVCLGHAIEEKLLIENPASERGLHFTEGEAKERAAMDHDQARGFIEAARADRFTILWKTLLSTGLRPSEAFSLRVQDIDFEKNEIRVRKVRRWTKDPKTGERVSVEGLPKTKKSKREIEIGATLAAELKHHLTTIEAADANSLIFVSRDGTPLDRNNIAKRFLRIAKAAGLDGFSLYCLRHTFATLQLAEGVHVKTVSARLGHKSTAFTLDTYGHVLPKQATEAAAVMDSFIS